MDDDMRRLAEAEVQLEELEKRIGRLTALMQTAAEDRRALRAEIGVLRERQAETARLLMGCSMRIETLEEGRDLTDSAVAGLKQELAELSDDLDDTLEDLNTLSAEMRRRYRRLRAEQAQLLAEQYEDDDAYDDDDCGGD